MTISTIGQTWRALRDRFVQAEIPTAALDARLLVRHVLELDETGLIAREREHVSNEKLRDLETLVVRRLSGEPVARIVGAKEFYGLPFALNPETLIPRPETEMLVDFGLEQLGGHDDPMLLDLGTGSGCIALSLLVNLPAAHGIGIDKSVPAIKAAMANAHTLGVADRFTAVEGDWFTPLKKSPKFDLIVSNPPYIASHEIAGLAVGVRKFDPALALDGGTDGLAPYRIIADKAANFLKTTGLLALEIGHDQGQMIKEILQRSGWQAIAVEKDIAGHDRMVTAMRHET